MTEEQKKNIEIFYCYAHNDQKLVEELEKQLQVLINNGMSVKWTNREVKARKEWMETVDQNILKANIILLLLSPDFMAVGYLRSSDMQMAFKRQREENIRIIPIYLRPVSSTGSEIYKLKFLPGNNKPVTSWRNRDEAFLDIFNGIKRTIEEIEIEDIKGSPHQNENIIPREEDGVELVETISFATDSSEAVSTMSSMQKVASKIEPASPTVERSTYLFGQDTEKPARKKGNGSKQSKSKKGASPFDQLLPLFSTPTPTMEQAPISQTKEGYDYEDASSKAQRRLINDQPQAALNILENVNLGTVPSQQRWRLRALRGHCYFGLGKFLPARKEYNEALQEKPIIVPKEQLQEEGMLYLRSAETNRELGNLTEAVELYHTALAHMSAHTQVGYLAEAHWGLALVLFEQVNLVNDKHANSNDNQDYLIKEALRHAEYARQLYDISGDELNMASTTCDIALFKQTVGDLDGASAHLKNVIETWTPMLQQKAGNTKENHKRLREYNNIVSAASCYLAGIEFKINQYDNALHYIKIAQETARKSYSIRKGEAAMMLGAVLEARHLNDPNVEKAFQQAIDILSKTDLLGAQVHAHDLLGRYFFKVGKIEKGEEELDKARKISQVAMFSH